MRDHRWPRPVRDLVRANVPDDCTLGFARGNQGTKYEPAVLGAVASVVKRDGRGFGADTDAVKRILRRQRNAASAYQRKRLCVALRLVPLLLVGQLLWIVGGRQNLLHRVLGSARNYAEMAAVYGITLSRVDGWEELQIEPRAAGQLLRQRFVQVDAHADAARFSGHLQGVVHLIGGEGQLRGEAVVVLVGLLALQMRDQVPLLRSGHQTYVSIGGDALAMENHLHRRILLIHKDRVISALIENHAEPRGIQIAVVGHLHLGRCAGREHSNKQGSEENGLRPRED